MAYAVGDTITATEYNNFLNSTSSGTFGYNHIAGTGSSTLGLGQTALAAVSGGSTTVAASQWNALFTGMDNLVNHTNVSITAGTTNQRSAGNTIEVVSAINADLQTIATAVQGGCTSATAVSAGSELQSSQSSARYNGTHVVEHTITFANNNSLRFFFNAGGKIRMSFTRETGGLSDGSASSKDGSVDELIAAVGNFDMGSAATTRSGSGETLTTNGLGNGASDLDSSYTTLIKLTQASGTYTSMFVSVEAKCNNTDYTDATTVTMKYTLNDADSTDTTYSSNNLSSVNVNAEFLGRTDFSTRLVVPTTAQGLDPIYTLSSSAETSNATTGD
jgi:hypothetical protein